MSTKTLIVIDMQYDFIYGALGTPEAREIVSNVEKKIKKYNDDGNPVIFTMDTHSEGYLETNEGKHLPVKHCVQDTPGWNLVVDAGELSIKKSTFGTFDMGNLVMDEIEIVGVCTDICVLTNALILKTQFPDAEITVDASCCAGTTPEAHRAALTVMKSCQINVIGE